MLIEAKDEAELQRFAQKFGGQVVQRKTIGTIGQPTRDTIRAIVRVNLALADMDGFEALMEMMGQTGAYSFSSQNVARLYAIVTQALLDGYRVSVHPLSVLADAPETNERGGANGMGVGFSGFWTTDPNMRTDRAWTFLALTDRDAPSVNVAVIDAGFAPNADFAPIVAQHDFENGDNNAGGANAAFCSSLVPGDCPWHGTQTYGVAGAILDNNFGVAGLGGQVARPMLYKLAWQWVFDMDNAIERAADDGADIINISSGMPCRPLLISVCNPLERIVIVCPLIAGVFGLLDALIAPFLPPEAHVVAATFEAALLGLCISPINPATIIQDSVDHATNLGAIVVAAAGNALGGGLGGPFDVDEVELIPCILDDVICAGEIDAGYNNLEDFGDSVDVWAPSPNSSTDTPDGDLNIGGTSFASPFVAGVLAMAKTLNPALNTASAETLLANTNFASPDARVGGIVAPYALVRQAATDGGLADITSLAGALNVLNLCSSMAFESEENNDLPNVAFLLRTGAGNFSNEDNAVHILPAGTADMGDTFAANLCDRNPYFDMILCRGGAWDAQEFPFLLPIDGEPGVWDHEVFPFDVICPPPNCDPTKITRPSLLVFEWRSTLPFRLDVELPLDANLDVALLNDQGQVIARAQPVANLERAAVRAQTPGQPVHYQQLALPSLQGGYYVLELKNGPFNTPVGLLFSTAAQTRRYLPLVWHDRQ